MNLRWFLSTNVEGSPVAVSLQEMQSLISRCAEQEEGALWVESDGGQRSRWERFLTGAAPQVFIPHLFLAWHLDYSMLMFYDENYSEKRAIDAMYPTNASMEILRRLHPPNEVPARECLFKSRALVAINEYLTTRELPSWLEYRYVK